MPNEPTMCVRISGPEEGVRKLIAKYSLLVEGAKRNGKVVTGQTFITNRLAKRLKAKDVEITVLYDATKAGKERQKEVMKDNPFADGSIPLGLGKKNRGGENVP